MMLRKLLKESVSLVVGKQVEDIVDLLDSKKHVNEFTIAKKLDITINQTRTILYKISDYGLVSSIRKKDKRKGWYTYFWKIEVLKSLEFLRNFLVKRMDQFSSQISSRKTKQFYVCERCNIEVNDENAMLYDFTCNECGEIFTMKDNTKLIKELKKNFDKLNNEIQFVDIEIEKEQQRLDKIREKEIKKAEKEKAEKKAAKKKERQKSAKKVKKKSVKKKTAKKKITKKKILKKVKKKIKKIIKKKKNTLKGTRKK